MAYRKATLKDLEAFNAKNNTNRHLYEVRISYYQDICFSTADGIEYGGSNDLEEARGLFKQAEIEASKTIKNKSIEENAYSVQLKEYRIYNYWGDSWMAIDERKGKDERTEEPTQERE